MPAEKIKLVFDGDLASLKAQLDNLGRETKERGKKSGREWAESMSEGFKDVFSGVTMANLTTSAIEGALDGVKDLFKEAFSMQDTLADFSALTGVVGEGLTDIGERAQGLASKFGTSAVQNVDAFKGILGRLGPDIAKNAEALQQMGDNVNTLAVAAGMDATASMDALTTSILQFGVSLDDPSNVASVMTDMMNTLAAGAKEGAAEIPQLSEAMKQVGVTAAGLGVSFNEVVGGIEVMATGGKVGAEAGVAMRNVMTSLVQSTGPGEDALKSIGLSTKELGKTLTTEGIASAMQMFRDHLDNVSSSARKAAIMATVFGKENMAAAGIMLNNADAIELMTAKVTGTQTATEQAATKMNTFSAQMRIAGATIQGKLAAALEAVLPAMTSLASGFMSALPVIQQVATVVISAGAAYGIYTLAVNASTIASALASSSFIKMTLALATNPIVLAAAALATLVVALRASKEADNDLAKQRAATTEVSIKANQNEIHALETRKAQIHAMQTAVKTYEELGNKTQMSAEEHKKLSLAVGVIERQYPGAIKAGADYAENLRTIKDAAAKSNVELAGIAQNIAALTAKQKDLVLDREIDKVRVKSEELRNAIMGNLDAWYKVGGNGRREANKLSDAILSGIVAMGTTEDAVLQGKLKGWERINQIQGLDVKQKDELKNKVEEIAEAQLTLNKIQTEYERTFTGKIKPQEQDKPKPKLPASDDEEKKKKKKKDKDERLAQLEAEKQYGMELLRTRGATESDILQLEVEYNKLELARMREIGEDKADLVKKQGDIQVGVVKMTAKLSEEAVKSMDDRLKKFVMEWDPEKNKPPDPEPIVVPALVGWDALKFQMAQIMNWHETIGQSLSGLGQTIGMAFSVKDPQKAAESWKALGKSVLNSVIGTVQGLILASDTAAIAKGITTFGWSLIADLPALAAAYVGLEGLKGYVNSLDVGGVLKKDQMILAHKNETVIPFEKAPAFFAEAVNQGAGSGRQQPVYRAPAWRAPERIAVANDDWFQAGRVNEIRDLKRKGA
jgi:TP901 family phage tail tape measure protein